MIWVSMRTIGNPMKQKNTNKQQPTSRNIELAVMNHCSNRCRTIIPRPGASRLRKIIVSSKMRTTNT